MNQFQELLQKSKEFGVVKNIDHSLIEVIGLPDAFLNETVVFENNAYGRVFILHELTCKILLISQTEVSVGMKVVRSNSPLSIPVGAHMLGQIIDPLGRLVTNPTLTSAEEVRQIDVAPLPMSQRARIKSPLLTGVSVVDLMVPLGKGQKELIIGDRKTGKTSFFLALIKHQISSGAIVIYCGIAKKMVDIKRMHASFAKAGITDKTIIVASFSKDSPALIHITPYTALTIAEFFRDKGQEVVVVLDDLTSHAKFYREISLLAGRFPGRESYPGNIFYEHAKLMERAGNFIINKNEVPLTILPVAETVGGDITSYICTNLMGMTDGHIFFDGDIFNNGRRPAVNIPLSVTRVGRQTQSPLLRSVNSELTSFMNVYDKLQGLAHFGAELTDSVKASIQMGDVINNFFSQHYTFSLSLPVQLVLVSLLWLDAIPEKSAIEVEKIKKKLDEEYKKPANKNLFDNSLSTKDFNDLLQYVSNNKGTFIQLCKSTNT